MSSIQSTSVRRELYADPADSQANAIHEARILQLLLAQDGSTTRLCETIAGGPVELHVVKQHVTSDVPAVVRRELPGEQFIERITSLAARGQVMMDNISYIALAGLDATIEADLRQGAMPIGHLLARLWVRRERLVDMNELAQRLWQLVGLPDASATRAYRIDTPESPRMVIAETYRRGMLMR